MLEINKGKIYINVFNNIDELAKYVSTKPRKPDRDNSSETGGFSFTKTYSFGEALDLLKYGDEELFNKIKDENKKINVNKLLGNIINRPKQKQDVVGFQANVPQYLLGLPTNMINQEPKKTSQKVLNIFLNIRVTAGTSSNEIIKIGTQYLLIIDLLEKAGYRCNLYSGVANSGYDNNYCYLLTRIKTDREPLNIKKICFTIAHPSMQRRIKFKWQEVNDGNYNFTCNGYGRDDDKNHTKSILEKELKQNFIIWTYEDDNISKNTEQLLEDLKKEYGINIIGEEV